MQGVCWRAEEVLASEEALCAMEVISYGYEAIPATQ